VDLGLDGHSALITGARKGSRARLCSRQRIDGFGKLDILVTCAGSSPGGLIDELTEDHWAQSLGLKFLGYVRSTKTVLPHMGERGSGSIAGGQRKASMDI
jgi:3-oxoacyl-[acyl-carrier protein] reductase